MINGWSKALAQRPPKWLIVPPLINFFKSLEPPVGLCLYKHSFLHLLIMGSLLARKILTHLVYPFGWIITCEISSPWIKLWVAWILVLLAAFGERMWFFDHWSLHLSHWHLNQQHFDFLHGIVQLLHPVKCSSLRPSCTLCTSCFSSMCSLVLAYCSDTRLVGPVIRNQHGLISNMEQIMLHWDVEEKPWYNRLQVTRPNNSFLNIQVTYATTLHNCYTPIQLSRIYVVRQILIVNIINAVL